MYHFDAHEYDRRMRWFTHARFGMFIHWGLYAIPARGEWVRSAEEMPEEYYKKYFLEFNPMHFDAHVWARTAKAAGMKYVVLTAKHHDGFCLFDTDTTDFKSTNTPFGRDIVQEFTQAVREEGLKVGLYYSLLDWHHPDYPHRHDRIHPMRNNLEITDEGRDFNKYLDYMHNQVRELCTNYGKIDLMWFDFSYDKMRGEKWRARELVNMVRTLQPDIILNNRLEVSGQGYGSLASGNPTDYHGDFITPEQMIPPQGIFDSFGNPLVWEACITMNGSWGYTRADKHYKPASLIIKKLIECVSKGGNMILNVGPNAKGEFPIQSKQILQNVGEWMGNNSASVYNCGSVKVKHSSIPKPEYGRITATDSTLYFHIYERSIGPLPLIGIAPNQIQSIHLLKDGSEIALSRSWVHEDYPNIAFVDLGEDPILPDPVDTVLVVKLKATEERAS